MYYRDIRFTDKPNWVRISLTISRFLSVSIICFLLLEPVFKSTEVEKKDPIVVVIKDISKSISAAYSPTQLEKINNSVKELENKISKKLELVSLSFGEITSLTNSDSLNQNATNISQALDYVFDNYADQNIGAIVLATDGIYNEGLNPVYSNLKFKAPIFTIGLGDTTRRKDIFIRNVVNNDIAYLGDKFMIKVDLGSDNCSGTTTLRVEKIHNGKRTIISESSIAIDRTNFFISKDVLIDANEVGLIQYSVTLSSQVGELTLTNNRKDIFIEVIDARQKVLIFANSPHPDVAALKAIISENKNYEVKTAFTTENDVNFTENSLVIFHNLPSREYDITAINSQLLNKNISRFFIVGTQTEQNKFNTIQNVLKIGGNGVSNEIIDPSLNDGFNKFTVSDLLKNRLRSYPPLVGLFGSYTLQGLSYPLLYQTIKKVPTKNPLLAFNDENGVRTAVFVGEGIWKWKMQDLIDVKNMEAVSELVNKSIQLLSVKDDKRKFRVNSSKNIYKENDQIYFDGQLYNDSYEMINTSDVSMNLKNNDGKEFKYTFSKVSNYYTLNAGILPQGSYSYSALTSYGGKTYNAEGKFSIQGLQVELYDLVARHDLLRGLSEKFSGKFYSSEQIESISEDILQNKSLKPTLYTSIVTQSLMNNKWVFFLLLILLGIEWFLRRYFGSY
jgi:hypothetical protein